jgi:hypothetical protein
MQNIKILHENFGVGSTVAKKNLLYRSSAEDLRRIFKLHIDQ